MTRKRNNAFTITEVIVATAISVIVIGMAIGMFVRQRLLYVRRRQVTDMHQAIRTAIDLLSADIQSAGYGAPVPDGEMQSWFSWVSGLSGRITIWPGAGAADPDEVAIVGALGEPVSALSSAATLGQSVLNVTPWKFNTTDRKVIFIGQKEMARVVSVGGGGAVLTVSTHPTALGSGLAYNHPAGSTIELVDVVTYQCVTNTDAYPYRPYLIRNDAFASTSTNPVHRMVAAGIENLQLAVTSGAVRVDMTARTAYPERGYTHPTAGDRYRRTALSATVTARNPVR